MGCGRHRQRIHQISINIPLFVFLFVVLIQVLSTTELAAAHDDPYMGHIDREKTSPSQQTVSVVRDLKLYSRCSGRHVSVKGRQVQAKAPQHNLYAWLRVETYSFESRVRIRSAATHSYLCFNENGRITVKHSAKGSRCLFTELHTANDYTEFQSVANTGWYLGFNREGRRLAGDQWTKARDQTASLKCYQFVKTDYKPDRHTPTRGRPGSDHHAAPRAARPSKPVPPLQLPLPAASEPSSSVEARDWHTAMSRRRSDGGGKQRSGSSSDDDDRKRARLKRKNKPPK